MAHDVAPDWATLDRHVLAEVLGWCSVQDIGVACLVCRRWDRAVRSSSKLWMCKARECGFNDGLGLAELNYAHTPGDNLVFTQRFTLDRSWRDGHGYTPYAIQGHSMAPWAFAFARLEERTVLLSASYDGSACVHEVTHNGPVLARTFMPPPAQGAARDSITAMAVRNTLVFTGHFSGLRCHSMATGALVAEFAFPDAVLCIDVSGTTVVAGCADETFSTFHVLEDESGVVAELRGCTTPDHVAELWPPAFAEAAFEPLTTSQAVRQVALCGDVVACAHDNGTLSLHNAHRGTATAVTCARCASAEPQSRANLTYMAAVASTRFVVTVSFGQGGLIVWDTSDGSITYATLCDVSAASFCGNDKSIICIGTNNGAVHILRATAAGLVDTLHTFAPPAFFLGHGAVSSIALVGMHVVQLHRNGTLTMQLLDAAASTQGAQRALPLLTRLTLPDWRGAFNCQMAVCDLAIAYSDAAGGASILCFMRPRAVKLDISSWRRRALFVGGFVGVAVTAAAVLLWWVRREGDSGARN